MSKRKDTFRELAAAAESGLPSAGLLAFSGEESTVLNEVAEERRIQDYKWGRKDHPDACPILLSASAELRARDIGIPTAAQAQSLCQRAFRLGRGHWSAILVEEVAEAVDAIGDDKALRNELLQVAAVAVAWIEAIDRRAL